MEPPSLLCTRPLLVRVARLDDVTALQAACFPEQSVAWVADYLQWCLAAPQRPTRLVALLDGELVGHVEMVRRQAGTWAELSSLVVARPWRRQGIGQRLVRATQRRARRWGCAEVRLQVRTDAADLLALYGGWGFEVRGRPLAGFLWLWLPVAPAAPAPDPHAPPVAALDPRRQG